MGEYKNIAILLCGHIRNYDVLDLCIKKLNENLISKNEKVRFKLFFTSWDYLDWQHDGTVYSSEKIDYELLKKYGFDGYNILKQNEYLSFNDRVYSQYHIIFECNELKKEYETKNNFIFDGVIRTRCDLIIDSIINIEDVNLNTYTITEDEFGFADWFCISNSTNMDYYSFLHKEYYNLTKQINTSGCFKNFIVDPHNILLIHLLNNKFGLSKEKILELRITNNIDGYVDKDLTLIESYYIDYYLKRVDNRVNTTFKKIKK